MKQILFIVLTFIFVNQSFSQTIYYKYLRENTDLMLVKVDTSDKYCSIYRKYNRGVRSEQDYVRYYSKGFLKLIDSNTYSLNDSYNRRSLNLHYNIDSCSSDSCNRIILNVSKSFDPFFSCTNVFLNSEIDLVLNDSIYHTYDVKSLPIIDTLLFCDKLSSSMLQFALGAYSSNEVDINTKLTSTLYLYFTYDSAMSNIWFFKEGEKITISSSSSLFLSNERYDIEIIDKSEYNSLLLNVLCP